MPFNGPDSSMRSREVFFDTQRKAAEEIARLERLILVWGVEMGERHVQREEFITSRENDLKLLWEKGNSINEREKRKQSPFQQLDFERTCNNKIIEPRIQHWDTQIGIIDARLLELRMHLRAAHSALEQQREILARFSPPVAGAQNEREQLAPIPSATPAA